MPEHTDTPLCEWPPLRLVRVVLAQISRVLIATRQLRALASWRKSSRSSTLILAFVMPDRAGLLTEQHLYQQQQHCTDKQAGVGQAGLRWVIIFFTWGYLSLALLCFQTYPHCAAQSSFRALFVHQVESEILQSCKLISCVSGSKESESERNGCRYIS